MSIYGEYNSDNVLGSEACCTKAREGITLIKQEDKL